MADIVMPRLSDSMEEGTILQWLKQVGDEVAVGDELVEIETDKANMAYESDVAGTLTEILRQEGETLPIGTPIARVGDSDGEGSRRPAAGPVAAGDRPPPAELKRPRARTPRAAPPAEATSDSARGAQPNRRRRAASKPRRSRDALAQEQGRRPGGSSRAPGPVVGSSRRMWKCGSFRGCREPRDRRHRGRGSEAGPSLLPRPSGSGSAGHPVPETAKGQVALRGALEAAVDGRAADGRVEGDRAALLPRRPRST